MKIAKLDGSNIGEIADHKSLFPNTSFPKAGPDADWLAANSSAEVVVFLAYDSATQKNESVTPYLSDGKSLHQTCHWHDLWGTGGGGDSG